MSVRTCAVRLLTVAVLLAAGSGPSLHADDRPPSIRELREQGRSAEAIPLARAQVDAAIAVHGPDHWETADARRILEALERIAALPAAEQARLAEADRLAREATELYRDGSIDASVAALERQLGIRRDAWGETDFATATVKLRLGHFIHVGLHDLPRARPLLAAATRDLVVALGDHPYTATAHCYQGWLLKDAGDLRGAEPFYRETRRILRALGGEEGSRGWALRNNLASYLREIGDLEGAEEEYRALLDAVRAAGAPYANQAAVIARNLAVTVAARGDLDTAIALLEEALVERRHRFVVGHPRLALDRLEWLEARLDRARLAAPSVVPRRAEWTAIAEDLATVVEELAGIGAPETGIARVAQAETRVAIGEVDQLDATLAQAANELRAEGGVLAIEGLTRAARLALRRDDLPRALSLAHEAGAELEEVRGSYFADPLERIRLAGSLRRHDPSAVLARIELAAGEPDRGLTALESARGRSLLELASLAAAARGTAAEAAADPAEGATNPIAERRALAAERFEVESRLQRGLSGGALSDGARESIRELQERRRALRERERLLERSWAERRAASATVVEPWTAERIRAALADGEVLLFTRCSDFDGSLFIATRTEIAGWPLPEGFLDAATALVAGVDADEASAHRGIRGALFDRLPSDARVHLATARSIAYVPDGPLERLPAEAVLPADTVLPVRWGPSATALLAPLAVRDDDAAGTPPEVTAPALIAIGDPAFAEVAEGGDPLDARTRRALERAGLVGPLPRLPGSRAETQRIAAHFAAAARRATERSAGEESPPAIVTLLGEEATEARLRSVCHSPRVLHLATHGIPRAGNAVLESALALARPFASDAGDDGFLTLSELLYEWPGRLSGTELVVLSACATAVGRAEAGEGTLALPWGFLCAGAESVVATLWNVDDLATTLVMDRFYENLLGLQNTPRNVGVVAFAARTPLPRAAALAEAKEWLRTLPASEARRLLGIGEEEWTELAARRRGIRKERVAAGSTATVTEAAPFSDPRTWAAFILIGEGR